VPHHLPATSAEQLRFVLCLRKREREREREREKEKKKKREQSQKREGSWRLRRATS
jgi:hypothetical protein